ncbi:U6 snRNA-associated Sm-like protein LSm6 [Trichinella spiralis]|uniref:U6 snRNA-associated Sm-like protein LSm6 n=1 Tax=Trichinella spiralis TaxID=6334 RepID=A0A0V1BS76_TRISP|nr:U6 snRNA-associated Sm-like protein LSm6 [Trichinella spiralis]
MSTRRRDRASENEQAHSDGGRTGADPEADPLAPPGGSLQWGPVREITPSVYQGAYYCPPSAFSPDMDSVEWLERLEDFFCVSRVPPSDHGVVARYLLSDSVRRELYPAGQAKEISFEEFKKRLLGTYGPEESTGQLIERFHALHQREGQTIEQYAQEVAEVGRRAGVSERDLVARFAGGITSKQAYMAMWLQEPPTFAEARKLVSKVMRAEEDFHQSRQSHTSNPKPEKTELAQSIEALIREICNKYQMSGRQTPSEFLKQLIGKPVMVKLNSGLDYRGILACLDGYLNVALEQTEEYANGQLKQKYGDAFIRGNNVLYISTQKRLGKLFHIFIENGKWSLFPRYK